MWTALDIFIGLALCYALISLFCTAIQEFIAQMLDSRGKLLVRALKSIDFAGLVEKLGTNFLANPGWVGSVLQPTKQQKSTDEDQKTHGDSAKAWFSKRLMTDLRGEEVANNTLSAVGQGTGRKSALTSVEVIDKFEIPEGLKARLRALPEEARNDVDKVKAAVEKWCGDFLPRGKPPRGWLSKRLMTDPTPENLAKTISSGMGLIAEGKSALTSDFAINNLEIPDGLKARLLALSEAARNDVDKVKAEVQKWCGDFLGEVNHWFTRRAQIVSLLIGFAVALALNVDTIELATKLNSDPVLREAAVKAAGKLVADDKLKDCPPPPPKAKTTVPAADPNQTAQAKDAETKLNSIKNCLASVQTTYPIPLGWDMDAPLSTHVLDYLTKLIGLLLTGVALSLGSRFWFDTLKTLLALRTGGQPKAEVK